MTEDSASYAPQTHDRMLQFFTYDHLPDHLKPVSRKFSLLAHELVDHIPMNPERTTALRKLLEAKDCAVRAVLYNEYEGLKPK